MNKIMVIECCCSRPKVEAEFKPDSTSKKGENASTKDVKESTKDVNENVSLKEVKGNDINNEGLQIKITKPVSHELKVPENTPSVRNYKYGKNTKVEKNYLTLEKGMIINLQEDGKISGQNLSDDIAVNLMKVGNISIKVNLQNLKDLLDKFNCMKILPHSIDSTLKSYNVRVLNEEIARTSLNILYDSSLDVNIISKTGVVEIGAINVSLIYIFNFNNFLILKEIAFDNNLKMFEVLNNIISFEHILNDECIELRDYVCSEYDTLVKILSGKIPVIIVDLR